MDWIGLDTLTTQPSRQKSEKTLVFIVIVHGQLKKLRAKINDNSNRSSLCIQDHRVEWQDISIKSRRLEVSKADLPSDRSEVALCPAYETLEFVWQPRLDDGCC